MDEDDFEELGLLVDRLDNAAAATKLPIAADLHLAGMKPIVEEVRDSLKAFLVAKGYNPWEFHPDA